MKLIYVFDLIIILSFSFVDLICSTKITKIEAENERVNRHIKNKKRREKEEINVDLIKVAVDHRNIREFLPIILQKKNSKFEKINIKFIHVDVTQETNAVASDSTDEEFNKFLDKVLTPAANFIKKYVSVYPVRDVKKIQCKSSFTDETGKERSFDKPIEEFLNKGSDYVFYVFMAKRNSTYVAASNLAFLKVGESYDRPACGKMVVNLNMVKDFDKDPILIDILKRQIIHVMTNALAFSPSFFPKYIDYEGVPLQIHQIYEDLKIGEESFPHLVNTEIKKSMESYFQCPNPRGLPLSGKVSFNQQIAHHYSMKPVWDYNPERLSLFLLLLYKQTGWYYVETSKSEHGVWGKNKGCRFLDFECTDSTGKLFEEYCDISDSANKYGCDYEYESVAICGKNLKIPDTKCDWMVDAKRCDGFDKEVKVSSEINEKIGPGSRCLEFKAKIKDQSMRVGGCWESKCVSDNGILVTIGTESYTFKYNSGIPEVNSKNFKVDNGGNPVEITIQAPNFSRFCPIRKIDPLI